MLANGALLRQAITDAHAELDAERPRREAQLVQLDTEAKKVDLALDRYFDAFETGDLSPAACKKRVDDLVSRRFCSSNAGKISKPPPSEVATPPTEAELAALAADVTSITRNANPRQLKALLQALVHRIDVQSRAHIQPVFFVPAVRPPYGSVPPARIELAHAV